MQEVDALADWVAASVAVEGPLLPLPAEASTRRFFRVRTDGGAASYIAMHAPPATEDNPRFLRLARQFRCHGLATPEIHAFDTDRGFVLMEDLGATDFASAYETHDIDALVNAAIDTLAVLRDVPADGIPPYEIERFSDELDIFTEWLVERFLGLSVPGDFAVTRQALIDATQSVPTCVVHRDYHSRNLIWRENGTVGIVDFQDALVGPACYDIASLLRDCYVEFAEEDVRRWRRRFSRVARLECPTEVFERAFDLTAMQRQLKAVGIFARLYLSRGRASHLGDIVPVLRRLAGLAATYSETAALAGWLEADVVPAAIRRLGSAA
ncbi:MAG: phosphotransferase [Gammaproteobacteria bacterium]|nr:phosphotransferase [Gammaproteobacteria bacterium]